MQFYKIEANIVDKDKDIPSLKNVMVVGTADIEIYKGGIIHDLIKDALSTLAKTEQDYLFINEFGVDSILRNLKFNIEVSEIDKDTYMSAVLDNIMYAKVFLRDYFNHKNVKDKYLFPSFLAHSVKVNVIAEVIIDDKRVKESIYINCSHLGNYHELNKSDLAKVIINTMVYDVLPKQKNKEEAIKAAELMISYLNNGCFTFKVITIPFITKGEVIVDSVMSVTQCLLALHNNSK